MSEDVGQPGAVETLRRRRDFLKAQAGAKSVRPGFIVRARQRPAGEADPRAARTGLTVSRKTGGAVQRNPDQAPVAPCLPPAAPGHAAAGI